MEANRRFRGFRDADFVYVSPRKIMPNGALGNKANGRIDSENVSDSTHIQIYTKPLNLILFFINLFLLPI